MPTAAAQCRPPRDLVRPFALACTTPALSAWRRVTALPGLLLVTMLAVCGPAAAQSQWVTDLEAGVLRNDNLGNASAGPDVHAATALTQAIASGPFFELTPGTTLTLAGELRNVAFNRYTAQDNVTAGLRAKLDKKFGLGRQAPHAYLIASDTRLWFRDTLRSGWLQSITGGSRCLFGDRLGLHIEAGLDRRTGSGAPAVRAGLPADVYDQSARRFSVGGAYTISDTVLLQLAATALRGDADYIETTSLADSFDGASAVARDPAFGPQVFVEKVQVRSLLLDAHVSWALGEHAALNLGLHRQLTLDTSGALYTRSIPALTYQYRFD